MGLANDANDSHDACTPMPPNKYYHSKPASTIARDMGRQQVWVENRMKIPCREDSGYGGISIATPSSNHEAKSNTILENAFEASDQVDSQHRNSTPSNTQSPQPIRSTSQLGQVIISIYVNNAYVKSHVYYVNNF